MIRPRATLDKSRRALTRVSEVLRDLNHIVLSIGNERHAKHMYILAGEARCLTFHIANANEHIKIALDMLDRAEKCLETKPSK